jgi:hypothetical protein
MNVGISLKLQMAGASLALTLVSGGCAMMTSKPEQHVAPPLGSTWVTARSDSGSFGSTKTQVSNKLGERMWQGVHVITFESPGFAMLAHDNGRLVAFMSGDKLLVSFDPDLGFDRPLEVGHTSTGTYRMTIPGKEQPVPMQVTQEVEAYEDVTVPAGTFKTFRVSWSESIGNENIYWISPELGISVKSILVRTAKHSAGPGRRENELVSHTIQR